MAKFADATRPQILFHVLNIFFGSSLGKYNCAKFNHWKIYVRHFIKGGAGLFAPLPHP